MNATERKSCECQAALGTSIACYCTMQLEDEMQDLAHSRMELKFRQGKRFCSPSPCSDRLWGPNTLISPSLGVHSLSSNVDVHLYFVGDVEFIILTTPACVCKF
jgi:hypothetical protein